MRALWLVAGGFLAGILMMTAIDHQPWLVASLKLNLSWAGLVGWFGALSGWAAATGAIYATWKTLPELRKQVAEAKRQSDFLVGDADPEFIVHRNRRAKTFTLTARNWNRRRVMIDDIITVDSSFGVLDMTALDKSNLLPRSKLREMGENGSYGVDGWVDRSKKPEDRKFDITFSKAGELADVAAVIASQTALQIPYRILGQHHEKRTAKVSTLEIVDE